jgi:hypothetical protein
MSPRTKVYLWCFLLAVFVRLFLIYKSPGRDKDIDLMIYRATGQLVVNKVNPYDFNDKIEIRQQLRNNKDNFNDWVCSDQDHWNYYTNSNLPLASLLFGGIEYCFKSARAFRYCFIFFDSILAVLILAFVLNKWKVRIPQKVQNYFQITDFEYKYQLTAGLTLGALSPILLLWGTYIPEPKGIGLLLILSSVYFADSSDKKLSLIFSPVLLGFSVAFMGLGIFMGPLCLYLIYINNNNSKLPVLYFFIALLTCFVCFIPFLPQLIDMMMSRMRLAVQTIPEHGSMWMLIYKLHPQNWILIKKVFIVFFAAINFIAFFRKRIDFIVISANLLFLFTCIYLLNGSMDRMNIAIASLIILLGISLRSYFTSILWFGYILYGIFSFYQSYFKGFKQDYDGNFVLIFTVVYFLLLIKLTFSPKS